MTVTFRATGAVTSGAGAITPAIPAGTAAGDLMIAVRAGKSTAYPWTMADPSGWTLVGQAASGSTVAGVGTGSMQIGVWWRLWITGDTGPAFAASTANVNQGFVMSFTPGAGEAFALPLAVFGGDEDVSSTVFSVAMASDPGVTNGDYVISGGAFNDDDATPMSTHVTASQTGITFSDTHELFGGAADPLTVLGGDMSMCFNRATVSGTSSAAPTVSGTQALAQIGEAVFIRLRAAGTASDPAYTAKLVRVGFQPMSAGPILLVSQPYEFPVSVVTVAAPAASGQLRVRGTGQVPVVDAALPPTQVPQLRPLMRTPAFGPPLLVDQRLQQAEPPPILTADGLGRVRARGISVGTRSAIGSSRAKLRGTASGRQVAAASGRLRLRGTATAVRSVTAVGRARFRGAAIGTRSALASGRARARGTAVAQQVATASGHVRARGTATVVRSAAASGRARLRGTGSGIEVGVLNVQPSPQAPYLRRPGAKFAGVAGPPILVVQHPAEDLCGFDSGFDSGFGCGDGAGASKGRIKLRGRAVGSRFADAVGRLRLRGTAGRIVDDLLPPPQMPFLRRPGAKLAGVAGPPLLVVQGPTGQLCAFDSSFDSSFGCADAIGTAAGSGHVRLRGTATPQRAASGVGRLRLRGKATRIVDAALPTAKTPLLRPGLKQPGVGPPLLVGQRADVETVAPFLASGVGRTRLRGTAVGTRSAAASGQARLRGTAAGARSALASGRARLRGTVAGVRPVSASGRVRLRGTSVGEKVAAASGRLRARGTAVGTRSALASGRTRVRGTATAIRTALASGRARLRGTAASVRSTAAVGRLRLSGTAVRALVDLDPKPHPILFRPGVWPAKVGPPVLVQQTFETFTAVVVLAPAASGRVRSRGTATPQRAASGAGRLRLRGTATSIRAASATGKLRSRATATGVRPLSGTGRARLRGTAASVRPVAGSGRLRCRGTAASIRSATASGRLRCRGTATTVRPGTGTGHARLRGTGVTVRPATGSGRARLRGTATSVRPGVGVGRLRCRGVASSARSATGSGRARLRGTGASVRSALGSGRLRGRGSSSGIRSVVEAGHGHARLRSKLLVVVAGEVFIPALRDPGVDGNALVDPGVGIDALADPGVDGNALADPGVNVDAFSGPDTDVP